MKKKEALKPKESPKKFVPPELDEGDTPERNKKEDEDTLVLSDAAESEKDAEDDAQFSP